MAVVAVLPDAGMRARLAEALRARAPDGDAGTYAGVIRACATAAEARAALAAGGVRALVVDARDAAGTPTAPLVADACRAHPDVTVVAYWRLTPGASALMVDLVRAGAHTVLLRGVDDSPHAMRAALRGAERVGAARVVLEALRADTPALVLPLLSVYLRAEAGPPSVAETAVLLGVHRRTLVNRMRAAGLPPPRALRSWCRVLVAAQLLERGGRTVESVARQLDFDTPSGLRNTLRRYTGCAPAALRAAGGLRRALAAFAAACAGRRDADALGVALRAPPRARGAPRAPAPRG